MPAIKHGGMDASRGTFVWRVLVVVFTTVVIVGLLLFTWRIFHILMLTFASVLIAVFLRGLANQLSDRSKLKPGWSLLLVTLVLLAAFTAMIWLLAPQVSAQVGELSADIPVAIERLRESIASYAWGEFLLAQLPDTPGDARTDELELLGRVGGIISTTVGGLVDVLFVVFVGIYLAINPGLYIGGAVRLMPLDKRARAEEVIHAVGKQLQWWLVARFVTMILVGIMTGIGLWLLGVPMVLTLALLITFLEFVPVVGPVLASIPAILLAVLISPRLAIYTALFYWLVQSVESYLLTPILQHRIVHLPPALVIIAELVMAVVLGFIGLILATPLLVVIVVVIKHVYIEDVLGERAMEPDGQGDQEPADASS